MPEGYRIATNDPRGRLIVFFLPTDKLFSDAAESSFRIVDSKPGKAIVEVILHEGRKHIVRRLLEHVGHPVISLVRTQVGPITLGSTKSGRWRPLSQREISDLYKAAGL